jgi:hypothetical protein
MLGDDVDDRVEQAGEVRGFPVVVPAMRDGVVDAALMVDVQRGSYQIHERSSTMAERTDGALPVLDGSGVAAGNRDRGWTCRAAGCVVPVGAASPEREVACPQPGGVRRAAGYHLDDPEGGGVAHPRPVLGWHGTGF